MVELYATDRLIGMGILPMEGQGVVQMFGTGRSNGFKLFGSAGRADMGKGLY
ncbi:hypothetical protein D3C73_740390 [compost metagenome]